MEPSKYSDSVEGSHLKRLASPQTQQPVALAQEKSAACYMLTSASIVPHLCFYHCFQTSLQSTE